MSMPEVNPESNSANGPVTDLDQAIKELLKSYPVDALEFLLPEIIQERGRPLSWEFHDTNARKHDLSDKGFVMDLNIRYTFQELSIVLVVLIEHWSTARSVDLHRTAHYYLDLMERFPKDEVIPVALITDLQAANIRDTLHSESRGRTWLHFETIIREVSREEASSWQAARNAIGWVLCGGMAGPQSRGEKVFEGAKRLKEGISADEMRRLFPLMAEVGKLKMNQVEELMKSGNMVYSEVADWLETKGRNEGRLEGKLEDIQKMLELGSSWDYIANVTGIPQTVYENFMKK